MTLTTIIKEQIDEIAREYPVEFYLCSLGGKTCFASDLRFTIEFNFNCRDHLEDDDSVVLYKELYEALDDTTLRDEILEYMFTKVSVPADDLEFARSVLPMLNMDGFSDRIEWGSDPLCGDLAQIYNGLEELKTRFTNLVEKPDVLMTVSWTREDLRKQFQAYFQREPSEEELDACVKVLNKDEMRKAYIQTSRTFIFEALLQGIANRTASIQGMPHWFSLNDRIVPLSEQIRAISPYLENIDKIFLYANCQLVTTFSGTEQMLNCLEKDGHTGWCVPTINELSCLCGMQTELGIRPTEVWSGETYDTEQENIFGKKVPCKVRMTLNFDDGEVCRGDGFTHAAIVLVHKKEEEKNGNNMDDRTF